MKTEENYTNKIINNLKDYFKQNQIENYTNPSFEDKMRLVWIHSPKKIIKNSWYDSFGDLNKRMSKKLDSLLFSVSNKLFFFESFILIKNKSIKYSNKKYYVENNLNKYSYVENGTKRELDYYRMNFFYEIIDYKEFLNHELKYKVISKGILRFYLFSLGEKSYYFEESKIDIPRLNIIFDELTLILNSQYSINKNEEYQEIKQRRLKELQVSKTKVLSELDKDGNGEVDVVDGNDFNTLLKKLKMDNIILKTILKIQKDFKTSNNYLTKNQVIELIFRSGGFFGKKTIWREFRDNSEELTSISSKCLFGLKSGVIFTNDGIYILVDKPFPKIVCFPFKQRFTVFKGCKKIFSGSFHRNEYEDIHITPTVLKIIDKWDFPLEFDDNSNQPIQHIEVTSHELKILDPTGVPRVNGYLKPDEVKFFKTLQSILKKESDKKENSRVTTLKKSQTNVLSKLDKDGNGEVDVIEGDDFNTLLKKYQKDIIEVDRKYVQQFVKVSSYLKTKKGNIQSIFNSIKDTPNQNILNKYVKILEVENHIYNLVLFNSLYMIMSLVEDDMITFYEIYERFDSINIFDSQHEKDVSQKLINIGDGLESLMYQIRDVGNQISNSIDELSYVTEESNKQLQGQLSEIHSTLKVGNIISVINTYQNYKINKNTKSLRG